jgi:hypothetical protein
MIEDKRVMYDRFSEKGGNSTEWIQIVKDFLNQVFLGGRRVAKCLVKFVKTIGFLSQDEVQIHLCKKGFMSNYLVWRNHGEVEPTNVGAELDGSESSTYSHIKQ